MLTMARARKSPTYQTIVDRCVELLAKKGYFSKKEVLKSTQLDCFDTGDINWEIVRRMIEEDPRLGGSFDEEGTQLMPIVESYFKRTIPYKGDDDIEERQVNPKELANRLPSKFMARGHGKKTAGYALVCEKNEGLYICWVGMKKATAEGVRKSHDHTVEVGRRAGVRQANQIPKYVETPSPPADDPALALPTAGEDLREAQHQSH